MDEEGRLGVAADALWQKGRVFLSLCMTEEEDVYLCLGSRFTFAGLFLLGLVARHPFSEEVRIEVARMNDRARHWERYEMGQETYEGATR